GWPQRHPGGSGGGEGPRTPGEDLLRPDLGRPGHVADGRLVDVAGNQDPVGENGTPVGQCDGSGDLAGVASESGAGRVPRTDVLPGPRTRPEAGKWIRRHGMVR